MGQFATELTSPDKTAENSVGQEIATESGTFSNQMPVGQKVIGSASIQRARTNPRTLSQADVLKLQRTIGNQAVMNLLNTKRVLPSKQPESPQPPVAGEIQRGLFGIVKAVSKVASVVKRPKLPKRRLSAPAKISTRTKRRSSNSVKPHKTEHKLHDTKLAQHKLSPKRRHSAPPVLKMDKAGVKAKLEKIKTATPQQRKKWLNDPAYMKKLQWRYPNPKHRHAITAALMEGHTHRWNVEKFRPTTGGYSSPFYNLMKGKQKRLFDNDPTDMACMESVLYSAHLAKILPPQKLVKFMDASIPARNLQKILFDQPKYWSNLGFKGGLLKHTLDKTELAKEFKDVGRMIFFRRNDNEPPWHVGLSVGDGNFVGMPGKGLTKTQTTMHIDDYLREDSKLWAEAGDFFHNLDLVKQLQKSEI